MKLEGSGFKNPSLVCNTGRREARSGAGRGLFIYLISVTKGESGGPISGALDARRAWKFAKCLCGNARTEGSASGVGRAGRAQGRSGGGNPV